MGAPTVTVHHPLDGLPLLGRLGLELGACAVGIAQGALDDVVTIAQTRRPLGGLMPRVAEDQSFQYRVGRLRIDVHTARVLVQGVVATDTRVLAEGRTHTPDELAERRAVLCRVAEIARGAVNEAFSLCGTASIYATSTLQRRARDVATLGQHLIFSANTYVSAGAVLLGEPVRELPF
jgi:alkylation response protein AidB-like acyl-CoA dehydrogenase